MTTWSAAPTTDRSAPSRTCRCSRGLLVLGYFPIPFGPSQRRSVCAFQLVIGGMRDLPRGATPDTASVFAISAPEIFRSPPNSFAQPVGSTSASGRAAGEDYELGYRLLKSGARFRFAQRALSFHQDVNTLERALSRAPRRRPGSHTHRAAAYRTCEVFQSLPAKSATSVFHSRCIWRLVWRESSDCGLWRWDR